MNFLSEQTPLEQKTPIDVFTSSFLIGISLSSLLFVSVLTLVNFSAQNASTSRTKYRLSATWQSHQCRHKEIITVIYFTQLMAWYHFWIAAVIRRENLLFILNVWIDLKSCSISHVHVTIPSFFWVLVFFLSGRRMCVIFNTQRWFLNSLWWNSGSFLTLYVRLCWIAGPDLDVDHEFIQDSFPCVPLEAQWSLTISLVHISQPRLFADFLVQLICG